MEPPGSSLFLWRSGVPRGLASAECYNRAMGAFDRLLEDIDTEERLGIIAEFPIGDVICAPGHRSLRVPAAVRDMADQILRSELDRILAEPILLGIFTDVRQGEVVLRSVDCLDGNHRLLAGLLSGRWQRVGDIPVDRLRARVNGWRARGTEPEPRWIPLEVAEASSLDPADWSVVPESWGARGPTAMIPGGVSGLDPAIPDEFRGIPMRDLLEEWKASSASG